MEISALPETGMDDMGEHVQFRAGTFYDLIFDYFELNEHLFGLCIGAHCLGNVGLNLFEVLLFLLAKCVFLEILSFLKPFLGLVVYDIVLRFGRICTARYNSGSGGDWKKETHDCHKRCQKSI